MHLPYRFGRYTLIERIAAGGTAEIYRAVQSGGEGFSKTVAVKRLLPAWGDNDEVASMLVDEARALTHLQHQAIVQVLEFGRCEGIPFLAMEYVDGIDCERLLTEFIRDGRPLPLPHALFITSQILLALEFAHRSIDAAGHPLGIVHRDISPSNILLSWNGEVKVTDFGIAKGLHRTQRTQLGQLKGKYAYMAPEQARGAAVDARADLFACGIVLCELAIARRLFDGASDLEVLEQARAARLPEREMAALPPELRATLLLALAPDPTHRYQSAAEMLADVRMSARAAGEAVTSLEFGAFLRETFPLEGTTPFVPIIALPTAEGQKTRPLCVPPPGRGRRAAAVARVAGIASLLAAVAVIPPSRGEIAVARAEGVAPRSTETAPAGFAAQPPPREIRGAIAIDSDPPGASGTLVLAGRAQRITTPFAMESIEIGGGVPGRVELSAPGYQRAAQAFVLDSSQPAFVKKIVLARQGSAMLSVNARPWGLVDIPGLASGRETPLAGLKLKAGSYLVSVRHPPSGQRAEARLVLADGESRRCLASFGQQPRLQCR